MTTISDIFYLIVVGLLMSGKTDAVPESGEMRLIADLMNNYDRRARPILDVSQALEVKLTFYILSITNFDERREQLKVFGVIELFWKDEYMTWDPLAYNGTDQVTLLPNQVWLPDIVLTSSADTMYDNSFYERFRVTVNSTGHVRWVPAGHMTTGCSLRLQAYPFDSQSCLFIFDNWMFDGRKVALLNASSSVDLSLFSKDGEWQIWSATLEGFTASTPQGVLYKRVIAEVKLKRKYLYYMVIVVAPTLIMSILSLFVFFLPPDSGEKISLGITVLLSYSVFSLLVADNLPKTSDAVPILVLYLTAAMVMTGLSLVLTVIVLRLHHHGHESRVPRWLRVVILKYLGRLVCYSHAVNVNQTVPEEPLILTELETDKTVTKIDENDEITKKKPIENTQELLKKILEEVKEMTGHLRQKTHEAEACDEWKTVAGILDRAFAVIHCIGLLVMTLVILDLHPRILGG